MPEADVSVHREYSSSPAALWAVVCEHEDMPRWIPKAREVKLLVDGTPRNGLGAVRRVTFRPALWPTLMESIVHYDEGERYDYKVTAGMLGLKDHLGSVRISALPDGGSRLDWNIHFEFRWWWAPFVSPFVAVFSGALKEGIETLDKVVAAS